MEICYSAGLGVSGGDPAGARRNLISNATQLIRATRGRGIIISSEARSALGCRGPFDVINLAAVWGLTQEKGREAVGNEARAVIVMAQLKRRSFRGVIDVVYGGEKPPAQKSLDKEKEKNNTKQKVVVNGVKRKSGDVSNADDAPKPVSKRELKRQAKKARFDLAKEDDNQGSPQHPGTDPQRSLTPLTDNITSKSLAQKAVK